MLENCLLLSKEFNWNGMTTSSKTFARWFATAMPRPCFCPDHVCQNITSAPKAGELLIHEALHIMGIESETFAPAVAYTLY